MCHARQHFRLQSLTSSATQRCNQRSFSSASATLAPSHRAKQTLAACTTNPLAAKQQGKSRAFLPLESSRDRIAEDQYLQGIFLSPENDSKFTYVMPTKKAEEESVNRKKDPGAMRFKLVPSSNRSRLSGSMCTTSSDPGSLPTAEARQLVRYSHDRGRTSAMSVSTAVANSGPLPKDHIHPPNIDTLSKQHHSIARRVDLNDESIPVQQSQHPIDLFPEQIESVQNNVRKAVATRSDRHMEQIWAKVQIYVNKQSLVKYRSELLRSLYTQILWGFMSIRRPNRAIQIWNEMVSNEVVPTTAMWDIMLDGFGMVKNTAGVDGIWRMMLESGQPPDKRLWATRIRALAASGSWQSSSHAFEEMAAAWLREVRKQTHVKDKQDLSNMGDIGDVPKPSIEALNGLINGLAHERRQTRLAGNKLATALSWSRFLGLSMDTYSFNPIIRKALRDGNTGLVNKLLEEMQQLGIKRDAATYTMIIQFVFQGGSPVVYSGDRSSQSELVTPGSEDSFQDKLRKVFQILHEAENSGVLANAYTFSTMISGLLKEVGNLEAAEVMREVMVSKRIPMSSQIYSSFITAYFDLRNGPDIRRVVKTWEQAEADKDVVLDDIFYDRLIEGFARCGEIEKMRATLAQMGQSGRVPGWIALTEAIRALGKVGEVGAAEEIVQDVMTEERAVDRLRKGKGKKWFWDTARAMGFEDLLTGEDPEHDSV